MRTLVAGLAVTLLASCASMEERRSGSPAASFQSGKTASEAAECVLFAWQNQSLAGVRYDAMLQPLPGGGKTVVSAGQVEFADFIQGSSGVKVSLYFQSGLMDWRKNRRTEAVRSCM